MTEKELLEEIRHELVSIGGLKAFDYGSSSVRYIQTMDIRNRNKCELKVSFPVEEMLDINFGYLIRKIDKIIGDME